MSPLTPRQLLDLAAEQQVQGIDLVARVVALTPSTGSGQRPSPSPIGRGENERRTWMQTLRAKPALLILILVLTLALLSGAAYALGRSLGYLPGVGLIEQGTPIRVLAAPLSQTRAGITLTVQEAVLTSDRTVIVMTLENIPRQAFAPPQDPSACYTEPQLRLPGNQTLAITSGRGSADAQGRLELRWTFPPIPAHRNEAEFFVPCIQGALPGQAPQNWVFRLRFVPAPPDLTVLPVQEVPTPIPATPSILAEGWRVEKVIETAEGYILVGTFRLDNLPHRARVVGFSDWPRVSDALGKAVPAQAPEDIDLYSAAIGEIPWSLELRGKQHVWPLTLSVDSVDVETYDLSAEFSFDAGPNPVPGQEWLLRQTFQLGEWQIEVLRARFTGKGYEFDLQAPDPIRHVVLEIGGAHAGIGSYSSADDQGNIQVGLEYEYQKPPVGQITVKVSGVIFRLPGEWKLEWMPEAPLNSQSLFDIRLVLDQTVELEDGYYLIGHLEWEDERLDLAVLGTQLFATDAQGNRLALEEVSFETFSQLVPNFSELPYQPWAYRLTGKAFQSPITLHLEKVNLGLATPLSLTLDLTPYGFAFDKAHNGSSYAVGPIVLEGLPQLWARLVGVTYLRQGDRHGFALSFEADPRLSELYFQIGEEAVSETGKSLFSVTSKEAQSGLLVVPIMTDADLAMPLTLALPSFQIQGDWTVEWAESP